MLIAGLRRIGCMARILPAARHKEDLRVGSVRVGKIRRGRQGRHFRANEYRSRTVRGNSQKPRTELVGALLMGMSPWNESKKGRKPEGEGVKKKLEPWSEGSLSLSSKGVLQLASAYWPKPISNRRAGKVSGRENDPDEERGDFRKKAV